MTKWFKKIRPILHITYYTISRNTYRLESKPFSVHPDIYLFPYILPYAFEIVMNYHFSIVS